MNKKIKKVFCDVDGTLLHNKNVINDLYYSAKYKVPQKNKEIILEMDEEIDFSIASGRIDSNLQKFAKSLKHQVEYIISLNGSVVTKNNEVIIENKLEKEDAKKIVSYLDDEKFFFFMFTSKGIFTGKKKIYNPLARLIRKWVGVPIDKRNSSAAEILRDEDITVYKFSINFNLPFYNLDKLISQIQPEFSHLFFTESSSYSIDINANNISKGEIIRQICKRDNIDTSEIAVIGDSGNDISMFELTNNSFCINHANKNVKNSCKYIVKNVAQALEIIRNINEKN